MHVRRYDVDLVPAPDLMLEIGDRVGVLVANEHIAIGPRAFRRHGEVGRRVQLCLGRLGMVLGVLLGLCQFRCLASAP